MAIGGAIVLFLGTFVFSPADHVWSSAVATVLVAGPFVAAAALGTHQLRRSRTVAVTSERQRPRSKLVAVGLALLSVAPLLLISRARFDRGISDVEATSGLLSSPVGGFLLGAAVRGQARLLVIAFGVLVAATVATALVLEPGGGELTVVLIVVLFPTAAIGLAAGGLVGWWLERPGAARPRVESAEPRQSSNR